jgi:hypothetical protein
MQELITTETFKLVAIGLVAFIFSLPIIVSRGIKGVLIMLGSLSLAVYVQDYYHEIKYSGLTFFCLMFILCLFIRPNHE